MIRQENFITNVYMHISAKYMITSGYDANIAIHR